MIFYVVVRLAAWLWGFPWPFPNEEGRAVCAVFSIAEFAWELFCVWSLCSGLYENRKKGGAK